MLALAGAAVFALPVFAVFDPDVFAVLLEVVFEAFDGVVLAGLVVLAVDVFAALVLAARLALVAPLFAGAVSPQAMPREPNARTDESTRTFFITKISCLLQEVNLSKFNCLGSFARYFVNIGTNANVSDWSVFSQPKKRQKTHFFEIFF